MTPERLNKLEWTIQQIKIGCDCSTCNLCRAKLADAASELIAEVHSFNKLKTTLENSVAGWLPNWVIGELNEWLEAPKESS